MHYTIDIEPVQKMYDGIAPTPDNTLIRFMMHSSRAHYHVRVCDHQSRYKQFSLSIYCTINNIKNTVTTLSYMFS